MRRNLAATDEALPPPVVQIASGRNRPTNSSGKLVLLGVLDCGDDLLDGLTKGRARVLIETCGVHAAKRAL